MSKDEGMFWRPSPPTPYRPTRRTTKASGLTLTATIQVLRSVGKMEAGCLWLGRFLVGGDAVVEAIVVPKQTNRPRNYSVTANAMQEVAVIARPRKWTLVAAVHSHPGISVEHSEYDDEMAPSRSALSLVFSNYGNWQGNWPTGIGVHEFIDNYWHLLPAEDSAKRVLFTGDPGPQLFDLR